MKCLSYDVERAPQNPVPRGRIPPGSTAYKVRDRDSWQKIARANGLDVWELIYANFKTRDPVEVNWYLHHYVGCDQPTSDKKNWMFSSSASPGLIRIPKRAEIRLSVPMRQQGQNPICWIACVAMVSSYKGRLSLGIGRFTGGFEPGNSSIPNPTTSWEDHYRRLATFGFVTENPAPDVSPDAAYIEGLLRKHGPFMLTHYTADLLAGHFAPDATHAIVITGINVNTDQVWYNNPWGAVDEVTTVNGVLWAMEKLASIGIRSVAYIP